MRRRYAAGVLSSGYVRLAVAIVQLAMVPVFAVHWGLELYGQWLMLVTIPHFLAASDFGFSTAASNRIIGEVARGDRREALETFQSAWRMILLISGAIALIGLAVAFTLPDSLLGTPGGMSGSLARLVMLLMMAYGLMSVQELLFVGVSRSEGQQAPAVAIRGTTVLLEGLSAMGAVWLGGGPLVAACCYLGVRTIGTATQMALARRVARWLKLGFIRASGARMRELIRPSLAAMVVDISFATYLQGTALAIGAAAGSAAVPLFTSLRTASRVGIQLTNTIIFPLMPEVTAAHARGNRALLGKLGGLLIAVNAVAGPILGVLVVVFGGEFLNLWTRGVIQPPQSMVTLAGIGLIFGILWNPIAALLLAISRHESYSYAFVCAAFACVGLTYVLTGHYGVTGAAAASLLLDMFMLTVVAMSLRKNVGRLVIDRATIAAVVPARWRRRAPD